ncbi:unnamed protein product [Microthlaspi erraticum]|uniref:Reverse transcriptase zinc-binding domain-containing protein n=1 Tax=Microthlaspi erraticum TaxID=1685480 RepID=A0A6D2IIZ4_9BRAS|nr:unnamed protein product [Microthlaspi erraticum]
MGKLISDESGIEATRDLRKYLGMPVLQKRINKDTFREVLEKVSSRLAGGKSQILSFAGRITLKKAVLSSIPVHTMSSIMLPQSTLASLDKTSRAFLWGDTNEKRRQHLLAWDNVCLPKENGGLGIRKAQNMNIALIAKLSWRVIHEEKALWARVMRSKYKVKEIRDDAWLKTKGNWSSTWRSVLKGMRNIVIPGLSWVVGSGRSVRFWKDKWLMGTPLIDLRIADIPDDLSEAKVSDLWQNGVGWMMHQIAPYISDSIRLRLGAIVVDEITGAKDRMAWGHTQNGEFSAKSAHSFFT